MRVRNKLILSSWAAFFAAFLFLSNASNPPNGYTGAPGDSLCTSCHTNPPSGVDGTISITGLPATVMPNTTYTITLSSTVSQGTPQTGGFQLVALNASNQNAGDLAPIGTDVGTNTAGGREYIEQRGDKTIAGGVVSWMFNWTSPPSGTGSITMYAAANLSNNNGASSGDRIITNTFSTTLQGGGPALMVTISNPTHVSCFGGANGSATAVATGGASPYTYIWSNGQSGPTASNLAAGFYTVTVTDAMNATATASVNITQPALLVASIPSQSNVNCFGGNNGTALAAATGGTPPYTYQWSNGASGPLASNLVAGTYTVTVTDFKSCTKTASVTITQPALLVAQIASQANVNCFGNNTGAVTMTGVGGTPPYVFAWSNGQNGPTQNNMAAGTYTVTLSDSRGCVDTETVTITQPSALVASITASSNVSCSGAANGSATVAASGGAGNYSYDWSNGANTATASGLAAGSYTVTVTDANQCTKTASVSVAEPSEITLDASFAEVSCNGACDGSVQITASGGVEPLIFEWNNGETSPDLLGLCPGTYALTVTDANGCTAALEVAITEPPVLSANAVSTHETGSVANDGTATAAPSGGTEPYAYLWSNGETTEALAGLAPGAYTVTVTDANQCEAVQTVIVNPFGCNISVSFEVADVSCHGGADGQATAIPANGMEPFSYTWSTGGTVATITGLPAGDYQATVTDASNCIVIGTMSIAEPQPLTVESEIVAQVGCFGANTGIASVLASGGTPGANYTYVWGDTIGFLPPGVPFIRDDLGTGSYTVIVIDGNGCENTITFSITQPGELTMTVVSTDETSNNASDGTATATAQGGTGNLTYLWSNGQNTPSIVDLAPGAYQVTATDENGCEVFGEALVEAFVCDLSLTLEYDDVVCHGEATGAALATPVGGNEPYAYAWSNLANTPAIAGLLPGEYSVTVTDTTNCLAEGTVTISEPAPLGVTAEIISPVQCPDDLSGWAVLTIIGGNSPYQALWPNGGAGISQTSLSGGSHIVTVTDAGGCTAQLEVIIPVDDEEPPVAVAQDLTIFIDENGQAQLDPQDLDGGSTDNCAITAWEADIAQFDCSHLGLNDVTLTVFDGGGNFSSASAFVTVADTLPPVLLCPENIVATNCDGIVAYAVTVADNCAAGDPTLLQGVESGGVFPFGATVVSWAATDESGNEAVCSFIVTVVNDLQGMASSTPSCPDEATGKATAIPMNGTQPYSYLWDDPAAQTAETATGLSAGAYNVLITDATGCTASASIVVEESPAVEITVASVTDETSGQGNGSIEVDVTGGTPPYQYQWSTSGATISNEEDPEGLSAGEYTLVVTDANGCSYTLENVLIDNILAVGEAAGQGHYRIFPNPAGDVCWIEWTGPVHGEVSVELLDLDGRAQLRAGLISEKQSLSIGHLAPGLYWLRLTEGEWTAVQKLIISR